MTVLVTAAAGNQGRMLVPKLIARGVPVRANVRSAASGAALRKLGPNATAAQVRSYIANLNGWTGVTGTYDFKLIPQRGVNWKSVVMTRWDPTHGVWMSAN